MNKIHWRIVLVIITFLLAAVPFPAHAVIPETGVQAPGPAAGGSLPNLESFIGQVKTGQASQVTGLYAAEVFAFPVVQQPAGQPAYVSPAGGTVTQFGMASTYGSLGFLAHNTQAGARFSDIKQNQLIAVVYGDGHTTLYKVTQIRRFHAASPASPYSSFVDLATNATLTTAELFHQTYGIKDALVLQTCITSNGSDTWGRLFIIAIPYLPETVADH